MNANSMFKNLVAVALIASFSSVAQVADADNGDLPPEATAEEARIKFWRQPEDGLRFMDIPVLEKSYMDTSPQVRSDKIKVGELGVDGGNKDAIMKLAEELANGEHGKYDSLLIAQNGKLIFESYYARGRVDLSHPQSSATKSYTGLAIGRAIQLGYLSMDDLDKPLVSFLKDLDPTKFVEGVENITLRKALTFTSGLHFTNDEMVALESDPSKLKGQGHVQAFFENSSPITPETQVFNYGGGQAVLVMQVLEAVVPGSAEEFIKTELLGKLGITNYGWGNSVSGLPRSGSGASMTSRNMLKFGLLAMNNGKWNGEQLISKEFMASSTNRDPNQDEIEIFFTGGNVSNAGYVNYWWHADMMVGEKSYFSSSAQGGGGQYIILIEDLDLVVVATAHDRDVRMMRLTANEILPAFVK